MHKLIKLTIILVFLLAVISLLTQYHGSTDITEYKGVAKFFAGSYNAKIRASHSIVYGLIHAPLLIIFPNFLVMKIANILCMILIILSVYYISGKNKRALLLMVVSPIVWYMGPWIAPVQFSSLLFLWGFFFIKKFEKDSKKSYLIYSGVLIGLSWAFWNTVIFVLFFFLICFFYNKNINHFVIFLFSVILGLSPLLILDQIFYGFMFYSSTKFFFGVITTIFYGSIYLGQDMMLNSIFKYITSIFTIPFFTYILIALPFFAYTLFSKKFFKKNKRTIIFLTLFFLFLLNNPQIRYILFLWPILIIHLSKSLNKKQFEIQFIIFAIISLLVINPYIIQIKYTTNAKELTSLFSNFGEWKISALHQEQMIHQDLEELSKEFPNSTFIVGNNLDDYTCLANIYWGYEIKEFVSIQDYNLFLKNDSSLFYKKIKFTPKIQDRRQVWIAGGLDKSENDNTDYNSINLGIGINEPINLTNFTLVKNYSILYLSKKT